MELIRCKDQGSKSLIEFYESFDEKGNFYECGIAMISLIERLKSWPCDYRVYGLTSHERLCLLDEDRHNSPWFVIIRAIDKNNYFIEYLMPQKEAPWQGAYVKGEAFSEDDAVQMILLAIEKSEGWGK